VASRRKTKNPSEYQLFLEKIPKETRTRVSKSIKDSPVESMTDFAYLCSGIIAEIFQGNIPPSVAEAAQPYAEMMYTAIASISKSDKTRREVAFNTVLGRLQDAANAAKTLEAKYVVDEGFPQKQEEAKIPTSSQGK